MAAYFPYFPTIYNNGGATLTWPMPGQACVFKAFRASFTLLAARYIAAADAIDGGDLALGLRRAALKAVAAADHICLTLRQALPHQPPHEQAVFLVLQVGEHRIVHPDHVHQIQVPARLIRLNRLRERNLPLQLPLRAKVHEDFIFNASARICCQADALVRAEGVDGLDQADRADGDQVVLMVGLGVVLLEDAFLKANLPRS